ncbi:MAG: 7TM diverse intracellular signaling domain-containing protein [Aquabacterium sp.]
MARLTCLCRWIVLLSCLLGLLPAGLARAAAVRLDAQTQTVPMGPHVTVLEDASGRMQLADVMRAAASSSGWTTPHRDAPSFGYSRSAFWLRADLQHVQMRDATWLIGLRYPLLDYVDVYIVHADGRIDAHASGDRRAFATRDIADRNFYFHTTLASHERAQLYVRIQSQGSLQAPLLITTPQAQAGVALTERLLFGVYAGAMLAMLCYNLMLAVSLRDRTYLHYVLYVALFGMTQCAVSGLAFEHLWPQAPHWGNLASVILMGLSGWSLVLFCRDFLDLRSHWPTADRLMSCLQWLFLLVVPASLVMPYAWPVKIATFTTLISPLLLLVMTVMLLRRGVQRARYFLAAFGVLMMGVVLMSLHLFGLVQGSLLTEYGLQIGSLLETILLSFALAHRLKLAQDENAHLQRRHAAELEARVQARTLDLHETMRQLTEANERLQELTEQDALTGLKNRMFLSHHLGEIWRHAQRWGEPLAALMIDIDHFKRVNDEHGHLVGDEALRQIALVLQKIVQRPGDEAVRYGGEEFLVLLPNTHLAGAAHVAENIRRQVEALALSADGKAVPLTVSVGVACVHATAEGQPQALINAADQLLYQAKQQGRNRCALHPEARGITAARPALKPQPAARPVPASFEQT